MVVGKEAKEEGRLERKVLRLAVGDERDEGREEVAAEEEGAERALVDGRDDDEGELEGAVANGDCEGDRGGVRAGLTKTRSESEGARGTCESWRVRSIAETNSCGTGRVSAADWDVQAEGGEVDAR